MVRWVAAGLAALALAGCNAAGVGAFAQGMAVGMNGQAYTPTTQSYQAPARTDCYQLGNSLTCTTR